MVVLELERRGLISAYFQARIVLGLIMYNFNWICLKASIRVGHRPSLVRLVESPLLVFLEADEIWLSRELSKIHGNADLSVGQNLSEVERRGLISVPFQA